MIVHASQVKSALSRFYEPCSRIKRDAILLPKPVCCYSRSAMWKMRRFLAPLEMTGTEELSSRTDVRDLSQTERYPYRYSRRIENEGLSADKT